MNLPNKLTVMRVIMIPIFVVFMLLSMTYSWCRYIAVGIFVLASITDLLDGKIARKYNLVTNFGKFMDPLADKLLVCTAMILLIFIRPFSADYCLFNPEVENMIYTIVILLIVAREFIISGFRLIAAEQGKVIAACFVAKVKTTVQMIMTITLLVRIDWFSWIITPMVILAWILIVGALVLTIVSLVEYLVKNKDVMKGEH